MRMFFQSIKCRGGSDIPVECYTLKEVKDVKLIVGRKYRVRKTRNKNKTRYMEWISCKCYKNNDRYVVFDMGNYKECIMKVDLLREIYQVEDRKTKEILKIETEYNKKELGD